MSNVDVIIKGADTNVSALESFFSDLKSQLATIRKMRVQDAAAEYVKIKTLCEHFEVIEKQLSSVVSELKTIIIPELFDKENMTSFNTKDGFRVTVSVSTRATMTDKVNGPVWLKENGLGALVTETVNASTLSATARTMLEEGKDLPQEYFSTYLQPSTSVTKVKPKA